MEEFNPSERKVVKPEVNELNINEMLIVELKGEREKNNRLFDVLNFERTEHEKILRQVFIVGMSFGAILGGLVTLYLGGII